MNKQKTNEGMKWWGYLICSVIIVAAIFMLLDMIKTFTSKSTSIGFATETKYFESAADIDVDVNQSSLQLNEESGFYEYKTTIKAVNNFDGTKNKYELLVNNNPCNINDCGAGYLKSEFVKRFYNIEGKVVLTGTLLINFNFYNNKTDVQIITKGNSEEVSYWKSFIANEGLNLNIVYAKF